jgi:hypothetical protein
MLDRIGRFCIMPLKTDHLLANRVPQPQPVVPELPKNVVPPVLFADARRAVRRLPLTDAEWQSVQSVLMDRTGLVSITQYNLLVMLAGRYGVILPPPPAAQWVKPRIEKLNRVKSTHPRRSLKENLADLFGG